MSTNQVSSPHNCCPWNTKNQVAAVTIGATGVAAIVTGFVLAFFFHQPTLVYATALGLGGSLLIADLLYVLIVKCKQNRPVEEEVKEDLNFDPLLMPADIWRTALASLNQDLGKQKEAFAPLVEVVSENWTQAKIVCPTKNSWDMPELIKALGISERVINALLVKANVVPQNGQISTSMLDAGMQKLETELGLK